MKDKTIGYGMWIIIGMIVVAIGGPILISFIRGVLADVSTNKPAYPTTSTTDATPVDSEETPATIAYSLSI